MWKVSLGFDGDDETINFGARQVAVYRQAVYESRTLAIVSKSKHTEFEKNPNGKAQIVHCVKVGGPDNEILIIIDATIIILSNDGYDLKKNFSFPAAVDCFAFDKQRNLFIALTSGDLYCLMSSTYEDPVLLKSICNPNFQNQGTFIRMFLHESEEMHNLILISHSGIIHKVKYFNLEKVITKRCTDDKGCLEEFDFQLEYLSVNRAEYEICKVISAIEFQKMNDNYFLLLVQNQDGQSIQLWSADCELQDVMILPYNYSLKNIYSTSDGSLLYGVTNQLTLIVICSFTLTLLLHQDGIKIEQMEMMTGENSFGVLLLIQKESQVFIQSLEPSGHKIKFQMAINNKCLLAQNQSALDDLVFIEIYHDDIGNLQNIHLKIISESQPDDRLERILRRGKFEEAESFARTFNLNLEAVYKSHLQKISADIQPWISENTLIEENRTLFNELLQKVEDTEFVVQCALNVISFDFEFMKETLKYAENRIKNQISSNNENNDSFENLYRQVRNFLLRLETFQIISKKPLLIENWILFQKANLIEECQHLIKQGKTKEVIRIWGRHSHELKNEMSFAQASSFFILIPSNVSIKQTSQWLQMFLPTIFTVHPRITITLVAWSEEKIKNMELLMEENWIENGLSFLKNILQLMRTYTKTNVIKSEYAPDSHIQNLLFLIRILTELSIMKKNHHIELSIMEYTETDDFDLMFTILEKVAIEELKSFINGFFQQLVLKKKLNANTIIAEYIKCLVEGSVDWWYWEEAPWEGRVAVLLECIDGIQEKLHSVLIILKNSPVPWSPVIITICNEALKYDNSLTRLIHEQKRMVDCKLVLKKYDLKDIKIIQSDFDKVLFYIFKHNREDMLEHALLIANTFDTKLCVDVYKFYIKYIIENKNAEDALYFLDEYRLSPEVIIACCKCIIHQASCLRKRSVSDERYSRYMAILDSIRNRLTRAEARLKFQYEPTLMNVTSDLCDQLKKLHYLKINFTGLPFADFYSCQKRKEDLLDDCLITFLEESANECEIPKNINLRLVSLAKCFALSYDEVLLNFLRLTVRRNHPKLIVHVLKILLKQDPVRKLIANKFVDCTCFLLSSCIQQMSCNSESSFISLVYPLTAMALNSCSPDVIIKGLEVGNWLSLLQKRLFHIDCSVVIQSNVTQSFNPFNDSTIMNLLPVYGSSLAEEALQSNIVYLKADFRKANEGQLTLSEALQNIIEQENEFVSFRIITVMHWLVLHTCVIAERNLNNCQILAELKYSSSICLTRLLNKLIGSRHLDTSIGSAVLHHLKKADATKWIVDSTKRYKFDFQRLYALTELGLVYFEQSHSEQEWNNTRALRKRCAWGKQVMEYGISYKEAFRESLEDRKQLLKKLMSLPMIDISILKKYCRDMDFDFQACLKVYLRQTLVSWEPDFDVKIDAVSEDKEIVMKNAQIKLLKKCRDIVNLIENRKEIFELLSCSIWDSINYYYYEVYLVLLTLMEEFATTASTGLFSTYRNVFIFLSSYNRISEPNDYEKEQWCMIFQSAQPLPSIAKYRLPFRLIFHRWTKSNIDPWKIIRPELNIRTYSKWFTILDALELDKNLLCTFAINQMTTMRTSQNDIKSEWCIHMRHQELLNDVQKCIGHITSQEMVTASLYFVMNHLPPGADQLTAAKLCFLHSKNWFEAEKSEKAKAGFIKCQKKYLTVSTTHILYCHNLGKPYYLQLVLKPSELIAALYNDPIILQWNSGDLLYFSDINKAAEEISILHREDVFKIRLNLLEEWLLPEDFMADMSYDGITLKSDLEKNFEKFSDADHDNFIKACYVVQRDIKSFGKYLTTIALDQSTEDSKPISIRLRALRCLLSVTTSDSLHEVTGCNNDKLSEYLITLQFISELEILGLSYSRETFDSCSKSEIVMSLLSMKTIRASVLAAHISLHFNINNPLLWNGILNKLNSSELIQVLADILPELTYFYHTLDFPTFETSWNLVILTPFEKAPSLLSEHEKKKFEDIVKLMFVCPIVNDEKLKLIREHCTRLGIDNLLTDADDIDC